MRACVRANFEFSIFFFYFEFRTVHFEFPIFNFKLFIGFWIFVFRFLIFNFTFWIFNFELFKIFFKTSKTKIQWIILNLKLKIQNIQFKIQNKKFTCTQAHTNFLSSEIRNQQRLPSVFSTQHICTWWESTMLSLKQLLFNLAITIFSLFKYSVCDEKVKNYRTKRGALGPARGRSIITYHQTFINREE